MEIGAWRGRVGLRLPLGAERGRAVSFVQRHNDLRVYQQAFAAAMRIFELSQKWPREERYALTDQIRRCSRSVCGNIAEAWRKRRYEPQFVSKLSDADAEVAEAQTWLEFAAACGYTDSATQRELCQQYDRICGGLVKMMAEPSQWCGPSLLREAGEAYTPGETADSDTAR
jgi:four helix bundle protein